MHEIIKQIIRQTNAETAEQYKGGKLYLFGPESSVYLQSIHRKAEAMGIKTMFCNAVPSGAAVIDIEKVRFRSWHMKAMYDVDNLYHSGLSCAADAVFQIIEAYDHPESNVAIIGRKHAVQGLREKLEAYDYTVLQCHTRTKSIPRVTEAADIVVNSAVDPVECWMAGRLIIDISGTLREEYDHARQLCVARGDVPPIYVTCHEVAQLNTSIVLNRFVKGAK